MQSNGARIAVVAVAIAALVGLFLVLSDDKAKTPTTNADQTTTESQEPTDKEKDKEPEAEPDPKPEVVTIAVEGGEPVGGVQDLAFTAGENILFRVTADAAAAVHLHGYDIEQEVKAGGEVTFDVPADIEGVFELELEETAVPIAEITVAPG